MNQARKDVVRANAASSPRILVVEGDLDLALLLAYNLEAEGYVVESVERGDEAELRLAENVPDLIILDWMLPGLSGLEICRRLRARENTRTLPVIMVTARGEESERVCGLSVGADDCVVKPFSIRELMARVHALLRRSRPERIVDHLCAGDLDLDRGARRVRRGSRNIHLGPTEFHLLEFLLEKPGRVYSRAQLLDRVWGRRADIQDRTVDMLGDCAGRCRRAGNAIQSSRFAASAMPSTEPSAKVGCRLIAPNPIALSALNTKDAPGEVASLSSKLKRTGQLQHETAAVKGWYVYSAADLGQVRSLDATVQVAML